MDKFIVRYISTSIASTKNERDEPGKRKPKIVCQQYSDNYCFFWCGDAICPVSEWLVWRTLSNNAMVSSKLKQHFTIKHPSLAWKDITTFII
jgi:hypothetical protein